MAMARLLPYHHSRGLLSTLRIFHGEDDDIRRVHVPLSLVLPYWSLLCGVSASTSLFTVVALERDGSLGLTRYDAYGTPEFWEATEAIEEMAEIALAHGGTYSVIPRLVQVIENSPPPSDEEDSQDDDNESLLAASDLMLEQGGHEAPMHVPRLVNTATAELRKVKEEINRLQAAGASGGAEQDATSGEVFMLPNEAEAFRAAALLRKQQTDDPTAEQHPARQSTPNQLAQRGGDGLDVPELPAELVERMANVDVSGVFVVLNARQFQEAVDAIPVSISLKSKIAYGVVHDPAAPTSAFAALQTPQKQQLIFSSACEDQLLHDTAVRAYRTMLRGEEGADQWAKGPQDNYYYRHIEDHVRLAAYTGPFVLSLSWRVALLMNRHPQLFEAAYGAAGGSALLSPRGGRAGNVHGDTPPVGCDLLDASGHSTSAAGGWGRIEPPSTQVVVPPYYTAATSPRVKFGGSMGDMNDPSTGATGQRPLSPAVTPSIGNKSSSDDTISFLMSRCPLVAMAASRAERTLLQASKKAAAQQEQRGSSLASRKSKMASTSNAVTPNLSPSEFSVVVPTLFVGGDGNLEQDGSLMMESSMAARSSQEGGALLLAIPAFSQDGGIVPTSIMRSPNTSGVSPPQHLSAEPFQRMLDAALTAMNDFDAVVELVLNGSSIALFVLQTCVVDMEEGQCAVMEALTRCFAHRERLGAAVRLIEDTMRLQPMGSSAAATSPLLTQKRHDMLHAMFSFLADAAHHNANAAANRIVENGEEVSVGRIRDVCHASFGTGHPLLYAHPAPLQMLLGILVEGASRHSPPVKSSVPEYLAWLRQLRTAAMCFDGLPIRTMEDGFPASEGCDALAVEQLYHWSVDSASPALRWASSYILHGRRRHEERSAFVDDVVYVYWVRQDTQGLAHGVPQDPFSDPVQLVATFVGSLPFDDATNAAAMMPVTASQWPVLPPRMKEAIRSGIHGRGWEAQWEECA